MQTGTIEYYGYGKDGRLLQDWSNRRQVRNGYVYLGNTVVGLYEVNLTNGTVTPKYQHTDALGSPVVTTNASKTVLSRMSYTPYGLPAMPMDGVGYTGHFIDVNTSLTYMQQRYYDPAIARFLSVDPARDGFNSYAYARNNPFAFTDPEGRIPLLNLIRLILLPAAAPPPASAPSNPPANPAYLDDRPSSPSVDGGRTGRQGETRPGRDFVRRGRDGQPINQPVTQSQQTEGGNSNPYEGPIDEPVIVVDSGGNAMPVPAGGRITGSPNRQHEQVRGPDGKPNGTRIDRPGHPKKSRIRRPKSHMATRKVSMMALGTLTCRSTPQHQGTSHAKICLQ